jgi:3-methylcrotonyl-CoA carboxylase alpha subunit
VAQTLVQERASDGIDPFSKTDGWRSHGVFTRRFAFEDGDAHIPATLAYLHDGGLRLTVGEGEAATTGLLAFSAGTQAGPVADTSAWTLDVAFAGDSTRATVYMQGERAHVFTQRGARQVVEVDLLAHAGDTAAEGGRLTAPMPGKVVSFAVQAGDAVKKGQPLAVMEAMKMEHTIAAPADGTVAELLYAPGDQVAEGAELLKLSVS